MGPESKFFALIKIGEKGLVGSLGVWGLLGLSLLALILAIVASCTGPSNNFSG